MHSKAHRMRRVFASDGRALIVAMDHAGYMGPVGGLIEPVATVRAVVAGGAPPATVVIEDRNGGWHPGKCRVAPRHLYGTRELLQEQLPRPVFTARQ